MSKISNINREESIRTFKLVTKQNWLEYLDKFSSLLLSGLLACYGVITLIEIKVDGEFSGFLVYFFAPFLIGVGAYSFYRKLNEYTLSVVQSNLTKEQNLAAVKKFLEKYNYSISDANKEVIIVVDEHMLSYNGLWRKKYVFIIDDLVIYFNITKLYPVISPPVLISHILLKSDLKSFLKNLKQ